MAFSVSKETKKTYPLKESYSFHAKGKKKNRVNLAAYRAASRKVRAQNPSGKIMATKALANATRVSAYETGGRGASKGLKEMARGRPTLIAERTQTFMKEDIARQVAQRNAKNVGKAFANSRVAINPMKNEAPSYEARTKGGGRFPRFGARK